MKKDSSPFLTLFLHCGVRVTAIIFKHIHLPLCKGLSVYIDLVYRGARVSPTSVCAHVPVDAKFEAPVVHVAGELFDASWEPKRVKTSYPSAML